MTGRRAADFHGARIALHLHHRRPVRRGRRRGRRGRRGRRRRRRRRHVHAHARVVADADLPVDEIARLLIRLVAAEILPILHREIPGQAPADEEPRPMLPRQPDVRLRHVLDRRERRRDRAVLAHHQAGGEGRRVVGGHRSDQFERGAEGGPGRPARPHAPPGGPTRNVEAVRLAPELVAGIPRQLDLAPQFLAADEVDAEIGLPGRDAHVFVAGRQLHHAAEGERRRLLLELGPQVELPADVEVAHVVAGPPLVDPRVAIDNAAHVRVVDEQRHQVAIDAGVDEERPEELRAVLDPDRKRAGDIADVAEALDVIRAAPVAADRPLTVAEHLAGRNKPQSSVAEEGRRRRSSLFGRGRRGRGLGSRWTLHRCRRGGRLRLSTGRCGPQREQRGEPEVAKRTRHQD